MEENKVKDKIVASKYFEEGLNCAESVIKAYNEEFKTDIPIRIASGLGGGCAVGNLCGAVNGACICASYAKGRDEVSQENVAKQYTKEVMKKVIDNYGSVECKLLKKDRVACGKIVDFSYEALKEALK